MSRPIINCWTQQSSGAALFTLQLRVFLVGFLVGFHARWSFPCHCWACVGCPPSSCSPVPSLLSLLSVRAR